MPIETTTVYTKERLLRFQNYVLASKKPLWIVSAVATAIIAVCAVLTFVLLWDIQGAIKLFGLLLIELCIPLIYIVIPRLSIKKAKNLNAEVHFSFDETAVHTQASSAIGNENASVFYTALHKIGKKITIFIFFSMQAELFSLTFPHSPQNRCKRSKIF